MSAARLPSIPPLELPRAKHLPPRAPSSTSGIRPTEVEAFRLGDAKAVGVLNRVLARRGVSNCEIAEGAECSENLIRLIRSDDLRKPFKVGFLFAINRRLALAILDEIRLELLSPNPHR